jgi:NAD(P)-dependent dehydrogenase (short-subunit alcohol dehydrogenase family)
LFKHLFERRVGGGPRLGSSGLAGRLAGVVECTGMEPVSVAVVTGAGRGIGRSIAELLVRRGHAVVVADLDGPAVRRTAEEIGAVAAVEQDVAEEASHRALAEEAARHGRLVAWVNNAGIGTDGELMELSSAQVRRLVEVNLLGMTWGMRAAIERFGPEGGDVVNIASLSGHGPVPGLSVYAATKAAVVSLSMSVHAETPGPVRVHALCPDGVATDMVAAMREEGRAKALVHSGGGLLSTEVVAAQAVALIGTSRVVRTVPAWRGGVLRATALAPSVAMKGEPLFRWLGRRAMRR